MLQLTKSPVLSFQLHRLLRVRKLYYKVASSHLPAPQILRVLKLYYKVASSQLPAPQIAPRTKVVLQSRHARSPQGLRRTGPKRTLEHFAPSTRAISAEGCARTPPIALSSAFRALDTRDPRRGLSATGTNRTLACISRTRHARSPQKVVRNRDKSHSRVHFAHSTHDPRRGLSATGTNRTLACISRPRRARSPQRVARAKTKSRSRLHFAHSTRTISAEGCAGPDQIALSPAFRASDTHDLRRGLRFVAVRRHCPRP